MIANTLFQQPKRRLYTWKSPGDIHRNQIDYILINQRYRNCITQVKTYPGADIDSDHNPVTMKIEITLKQIKKRQSTVHLDLNMLKDENIRLEYNILVQKRFNRLMNEEKIQIDTEEKIEHMWNALKESMTKATEEVLPRAKRKAKQTWMTEKILEKISERQKMKNVSLEKYEHINKEITKECRKAQDEWWNNRCEEVEQLDKQHKSSEMHKKVKEITGQGRAFFNRQTGGGGKCPQFSTLPPE